MGVTRRAPTDVHLIIIAVVIVVVVASSVITANSEPPRHELARACESMEGFKLYTSADHASPSTTGTADVDQAPGPGNAAPGHPPMCLRTYAGDLIYETAYYVCSNHGARLVITKTRATLDFLYKVLPDNVTRNPGAWVGLDGQTAAPRFYWPDGSELPLTSPLWWTDRPQQHLRESGKRRCVHTYSSRGVHSLSDSRCRNYYRTVICEVPLIDLKKNGKLSSVGRFKISRFQDFSFRPSRLRASNSRVEYDHPRNFARSIQIRLYFKTEHWRLLQFKHSGLLFYMGSHDPRKTDFFALYMENGTITFSFNLGTGTANITSPNYYDDGNLHEVIFGRQRKTGSLMIDSKRIGTVTSPGWRSTARVKKPIFVGGISPDLKWDFKQKLWKPSDPEWSYRIWESFPGCILDVRQRGRWLGAPSKKINTTICTYCTTPPSVPYASIVGEVKNAYEYEDSVEYKCHEGYKKGANSETSAECGWWYSSAIWKRPKLTCIDTCQTLDPWCTDEKWWIDAICNHGGKDHLVKHLPNIQNMSDNQ